MFYNKYDLFARFEAHLQNEHGAIFDIEFLISVSQFKQINQSLPDLSTGAGACVTPPRSVQGGDDERAPGVEVTTQTPARPDTSSEEVLCSKCQEPLEDSGALLDRTEIKHEPKEESLAGKAPGPESPVEAVSGLSVRRPHLHSMDLQVQPGHNYRIATAFWFLCISFPILSYNGFANNCKPE